jgi:hypothetical protein
MNPPRNSITADRGHNKPTPKCVVCIVEQISANHTIRFAEQLCLSGHIGACNNQQRGLAGLIRPPVASIQRRQSEERRASRSIPVYVRRSELLWSAVNGGVA